MAPRVVVERVGQRGPETLLMRATLVGVDRVRELNHVLLVPGVPLHRDFDVIGHMLVAPRLLVAEEDHGTGGSAPSTGSGA